MKQKVLHSVRIEAKKGKVNVAIHRQDRSKKSMEKLFPSLLIALDVCAAIVYACFGDVRHTVYWFSAAVLTISVTF